MIHKPSLELPIKQTMIALNRLRDEWMIENIWVSNFTVDQFKEAQSYSDSKIVNNQIEYSLLTRNQWKYAWWIKNMESEIIPYCQKEWIFVTAVRPIERGIFATWFQVIDDLVEKYNKTHAQIAINWLLSKDNLITIPKSSNKERLEENIGAVGRELDAEDVSLLDTTVFVVDE